MPLEGVNPWAETLSIFKRDEGDEEEEDNGPQPAPNRCSWCRKYREKKAYSVRASLSFPLEKVAHLVGCPSGPGNGAPRFEHALVPAVGTAASAHPLGSPTLSPPSFSGGAVLSFPVGFAPFAEQGLILLLPLALHFDLLLSLSLRILGPLTLGLGFPSHTREKQGQPHGE